eukprot:m.9773 g.9773  ORF g.9773 m.9773 type:complete len:304 (+) comp5044_c0_seq1:1424-2335(+)
MCRPRACINTRAACHSTRTSGCRWERRAGRAAGGRVALVDGRGEEDDGDEEELEEDAQGEDVRDGLDRRGDLAGLAADKVVGHEAEEDGEGEERQRHPDDGAGQVDKPVWREREDAQGDEGDEQGAGRGAGDSQAGAQLLQARRQVVQDDGAGQQGGEQVGPAGAGGREHAGQGKAQRQAKDGAGQQVEEEGAGDGKGLLEDIEVAEDAQHLGRLPRVLLRQRRRPLRHVLGPQREHADLSSAATVAAATVVVVVSSTGSGLDVDGGQQAEQAVEQSASREKHGKPGQQPHRKLPLLNHDSSV